MVYRFKGPLEAFRISDRRHPIFDGMGASLHGARWNSPGIKAIYGILSYEGALLEKLALVGRVGDLPKSQQSIKIQVPQGIEIEEIYKEDIPGWNAPDYVESRKYGDKWLKEERTAILVVPALVSPEEKSVLFNPEHPDFKVITVSQPKDIIWDPRLFHPIG